MTSYDADPDADPDGPGRSETPDERHDRNWIELLNELRVAQTGIQLIAGFLLTIPFSDRFGTLSPLLRRAYLVSFALAATATLLVIAPTTLHRALYRRHRKGELVTVSDRLAKAGLGFLGLTLISVAFLIFGVAAGTAAGVVAAVVVAVAAGSLWVALPLRLRGQRRRTRPSGPPDA